MKTVYFIPAIALGTIVLSSCGGMHRLEKRGPVAVNPNKLSLVEKNGVVPVKYSISDTEKKVPKRAQLLFSPQFEYGDQVTPISSVAINGKRFERSEERKMRRKGVEINDADLNFATEKGVQTVFVDDVAKFSKMMPNAQLVGYTIAKTPQHEKVIGRTVMANGVDVVPEYKAPKVSVKKVPVVTKNKQFTQVTFPIDSDVITPSFAKNSTEIADLKATLNSIKSNPNNKITRIVVTGVSSPDGSYQYNKALADKRAAAGRDFLITQMGIPSSMIQTQSITEDWNGLKEVSTKAGLNNVAKIITIADSHQSDAQKYRQMHALPNYNYLAKNILPQLRKVTFDIYYDTTTTKEVTTIR